VPATIGHRSNFGGTAAGSAVKREWELTRLSNPSTARPANLPAPRFDEWSWQLEGSCLAYPPEMFFPDERGGQLRRREATAISVCRDCPVVVKCRDYALTAPEMHGIWGAMTARERVSVLSRRLRPEGAMRTGPRIVQGGDGCSTVGG
jgi:WhiB family transcriptional regulator, redox-sensing transcriptional regulator